MQTNEQILILQLQQGMEVGYATLYREHYGPLCHFASLMLQDDFAAESVVEDVILHLWENRQQLDIHTSLRSYLLRSVKNKCLDHIKLKYTRTECQFSTLSTEEVRAFDQRVATVSPVEQLVGKELEREVMQTIEGFPIECRTVFMKSRMEGKNNQEISDEMGISVNTVKYHIKKALRQLKKFENGLPLILILSSIYKL